MIVKQHSARSFAAVSDYLLHDKQAASDERVEWTHADNLFFTALARDAAAEMQRTFEDAPALKREAGLSPAGRPVRNPAFHLSLSWARDEHPSQEQMLGAARDALGKLGLEKHQALLVCHNDEPHPHVHVLVSRIDPETGRANNLSRSKRKLQAWALAYEQQQGKVRCKQREENARKLERGEKPRYDDPVIRGAWDRSDTGKAFQAALAARGYTLAQGHRRIVVVDREGKAINPARALHGVRAAQIKARLSDLDTSALPRAEDVRKEREQVKGEAGDARTRRGADQGARERAKERARKEARTTDKDAEARADKGPVGKQKGTEAAREAGAAGDRAAGQRGGQAQPAVFDRDRYHAQWEEAIAQAAIRAERERRAPVTETTKPSRAREQKPGGRAEEARVQGAETTTGPPRVRQAPVFDRDRYNAAWEKAIIEAAIREEQNRQRPRGQSTTGRDDSARDWIRTGPPYGQVHQRPSGLTPRQWEELAQAGKSPEAFESWASRCRASLQDRQLAEQGDLLRRHDRKRDRIEEELARHHEPFLKAQRERLHEIGERARRGGMFYRLSGREEADRQEAEDLQASIDNAHARIAERLGALSRDKARESEELKNRHERERRSLDQGIEIARPANLNERTEEDRPRRDFAREIEERRRVRSWEEVQAIREAARRSRDRGPER